MDTSTAYVGKGVLTVIARTGGGALPVEGAAVTVRPLTEGGSPIRTVYTDESGRTPPLSLNSPPAATSLSPGNARPYAVYEIVVEKDGFYTHRNQNAPIFTGVTSMQYAELIPRAPYGDGTPPAGNTDFYTGQALNEEE
jgi:hypothetical protein